MKGILIACLLLCLPCLGEIRAVIFDYHGVIVDKNSDILLTCFEHEMHITHEALQSRRHNGVVTGEIDEEEFWDELSGGALPDDWRTSLQDAYADATPPVMGMTWLVYYLQRTGYRTALLTNVLPSCHAVNEKKGRYRIFDPAIISCDVGMAKPDPAIYLYTADLLELKPDECLFIDDHEENLTSAEDLGMATLKFTSFDQLCRDLIAIGVLHRGKTP